MTRLHIQHLRHLWWACVSALALLPTSCEQTGEGVVDMNGTPLYVSAASVQPTVVDLRTITPVNGRYPVSVVVTAQVTGTETAHAPFAILAELSAPGGESLLQQIALHDDGVAPDAMAGDGRYAGTFKWDATKQDIGRFPVRISAKDKDGFDSNLLEIPLDIIRQNNPPVLSNLTAPDTVLLPSGGSLLVVMSVAASDPDGRDDVREVFFRSLDSSDPNRKFFLYDDGLPSSGDKVGDDGIYTITVSLVDNSPTIRRTYRFAFQAVDSPGDTSATLLHTLTVR